MDVIIALVFISLTLVVAGLVFFFTRLFEGDFEHGDRLSLLPLADDDGTSEKPTISLNNTLDKSDNPDRIDRNQESVPNVDAGDVSDPDPD